MPGIATGELLERLHAAGDYRTQSAQYSYSGVHGNGISRVDEIPMGMGMKNCTFPYHKKWEWERELFPWEWE